MGREIAPSAIAESNQESLPLVTVNTNALFYGKIPRLIHRKTVEIAFEDRAELCGSVGRTMVELKNGHPE